MKRNTKVAARVVFLIYMALLCAVFFVRFEGGLAKVPYELFGIPMDKIVHFIMFLPFPFLAWSSFYGSKGKPWSMVMFMTAVLVTGVAAAGSTEIIQGLTEYRSRDITDFRADCLGLLTGSLATLAYGVVTKRR